MNRFAAYAVISPVAASLTLYVNGYYPPEKQGEMHAPHEHIEANSSAMYASVRVTGAPVYLGTSTYIYPGTTLPSTRW